MTMQMTEAFDADMLTRLTKYTISAGSYDANNDWVEGSQVVSTIFGVIIAGNKFSQLEEGISVDAMPGGERLRDYISMSCIDKYKLDHGDMASYKGKYYRVIQMSDEDTYGYREYLLEKDKNWSPA